MVNFKAMPPVDPEKRKEQAPKITRLLNGAAFEFLEWAKYPDGREFIAGRYLDYAGEWCAYSWTDRGRVRDEHYPKFAEMGLDWSSAR